MCMENSTHIGDTVRIRRPPKVRTSALGHSVWMPDVDTIELEVEDDTAAGCDPYDTAAGDQWSARCRELLANS